MTHETDNIELCNVRKLHRPRMSESDAFLADSVNTTLASL